MLQKLPRALVASGIALETELAVCPPLPIQAGSGSNDLRNYKEVWCRQNCKVSAETTGMYEAGGNLFWVDMQIPEAVGSQGVIADEPPLSQVIEYAEQFF